MSAVADIVAFWREAGPKKWFGGGTALASEIAKTDPVFG